MGSGTDVLFKPDDTITSQFYVGFGLLKSGSLMFQVTHNGLVILIGWGFWGRLGGGRRLNQLLSGKERFWDINWASSQKKI